MSNCIVEKRELFEKLSDTAKHIASHDMKEKMGSQLFSTMVKDAHFRGFTSGEEYQAYLRPFEEEILTIREANGESVKTKGGKWLYSKVSMNAEGDKPTSSYRVNKSVICRTLDAGKPLQSSSGEPLGKTALEQAYKAETVPRSVYSKVCRHATDIKELWTHLTEKEQEAIKNYIARL